MFVEKFLNNGIPYFRLVESKRYTRDDGIRTVRKKCIYNISPLAKFTDESDDYVDRLKQSFKDGNPILPALQIYCSSQPIRQKYSLNLSEGDTFCIGHPKLFSHILIERILEELGLISFLIDISSSLIMSLILLAFFVFLSTEDFLIHLQK